VRFAASYKTAKGMFEDYCLFLFVLVLVLACSQ
jgi:hypothetical protein